MYNSVISVSEVPCKDAVAKGTNNQSQSLQTQIIKILFSIQICSINLTFDTVV